MDALMGHFQTQHMKSFLDGLPDLVSGEIITRRYAVQTVEEENDKSRDEQKVEAPPVIH